LIPAVLTSAFVSVSVNLCFMSFAIDMKTFSTLRFVFALCNNCNHISNLKSILMKNSRHVLFFYLAHRLKEFDSILISQSLALCCWNSLNKKITNQYTIIKLLKVKYATKDYLPFCFHPYQLCYQPIFC
jgi:hypothetical protein